jgi:hypothetical protein
MVSIFWQRTYLKEFETQTCNWFMAGRALAVSNGDELAKLVMKLGENLGLEAKEQVRVARRIWGAERRIDVVLIHPTTRKTLGIECKRFPRSSKTLKRGRFLASSYSPAQDSRRTCARSLSQPAKRLSLKNCSRGFACTSGCRSGDSAESRYVFQDFRKGTYGKTDPREHAPRLISYRNLLRTGESTDQAA